LLRFVCPWRGQLPGSFFFSAHCLSLDSAPSRFPSSLASVEFRPGPSTGPARLFLNRCSPIGAQASGPGPTAAHPCLDEGGIAGSGTTCHTVQEATAAQGPPGHSPPGAIFPSPALIVSTAQCAAVNPSVAATGTGELLHGCGPTFFRLAARIHGAPKGPPRGPGAFFSPDWPGTAPRRPCSYTAITRTSARIRPSHAAAKAVLLTRIIMGPN